MSLCKPSAVKTSHKQKGRTLLWLHTPVNFCLLNYLLASIPKVTLHFLLLKLLNSVVGVAWQFKS